MHINFKPNIHTFFTPHVESDEKKTVKITEEIPIYNTNTIFQSGYPFFFDTSLFRGKGCMYSRLHPNFPVSDPRYKQKHLIIRIVGQFKRPLELTDIFIGGFFENGVRGLPPTFALNWGLKLARKITSHFFINLTGGKPFIAVPLIPLVDELIVLPFEGQSENFWKEWDLSQPMKENWTAAIPRTDSHLRKTAYNSTAQRNLRQSLRNHKNENWFRLPIDCHHLFGLEISDSAFLFEKLIIQYKVMNLFNININLKHFINDLPFTLFLANRKSDKNQTVCKGCGHVKKSDLSYSSFPDGWKDQGFCNFCFPTKDKNQILLSLLVTNL